MTARAIGLFGDCADDPDCAVLGSSDPDEVIRIAEPFLSKEWGGEDDGTIPVVYSTDIEWTWIALGVRVETCEDCQGDDCHGHYLTSKEPAPGYERAALVRAHWIDVGLEVRP